MRTKDILGKLRLHGRTVFDEERQALFFNWTCSGFTAVFTGSTLKARFVALGDKGPAFPGFPEPQPDYPCFGVAADGGDLTGRTECRKIFRHSLELPGISRPIFTTGSKSGAEISTTWTRISASLTSSRVLLKASTS